MEKVIIEFNKDSPVPGIAGGIGWLEIEIDRSVGMRNTTEIKYISNKNMDSTYDIFLDMLRLYAYRINIAALMTEFDVKFLRSGKFKIYEKYSDIPEECILLSEVEGPIMLEPSFIENLNLRSYDDYCG